MPEIRPMPAYSVDGRLKELIPFGEEIAYKSRARISRRGWRQPSKNGYLVVTASGVAFIDDGEENGKENFGAYVPYTHMAEVKNKEGTVEFKIKNPKLGEEPGWKLTVERHDGEDKKSFKKREEMFSRTFEELMKRRLAIYF